jgi:hypothetical protein
MATLPVYRTWTPGEVVTAAYFNTNTRDPGNFWLARPLGILRQATPQSLPNATWTAVIQDTEDLNRDGGHSISTNPTRYTWQTAGYMMVTGAVAHGFNTTGTRGAGIAFNGTQVNYTALLGPPVTATWGLWMSTGVVFLTATVGQYAEILAFQNITGGGALSTVAGSNFQVLWVSE